MRRISADPRPNWQKRVEEYGLFFHTLRGEPYWDETAYYQFTHYQIDTLELAAQTLHDMCMDLVREVIEENMLGLFLIPKKYEEFVIKSWEEQHPSVYGRLDLAYDGVSPPKLLEYNSDTPTALVEAAVAQWYWLKDVDERGDQFNSIHEQLIEAWQKVYQRDPRPLHFTALSKIDTPEDYITAEYMRDTAIQAGFETTFLDITEIGWHEHRRVFVDTKGQPIEHCFKLYPWEWIFREDFGPRVVSNSRLRWVEPPWKAILSSKSILPLLYDRHPDCPFLLPASFAPLDTGDYIRKPVHAREGANIQVVKNGQTVQNTGGPYNEGPYVYQAMAPIKAHDERYPVIGSWIVNDVACGIGIREDNSLITRNTSRFVPHQMSS